MSGFKIFKHFSSFRTFSCLKLSFSVDYKQNEKALSGQIECGTEETRK